MAKKKNVNPVARRVRNNEPDFIAESYEAAHTDDAKRRSLHYYRDEFWTYTGTHYERLHDNSVKSRFHTHFVTEIGKTDIVVRNGGLENASLAALKARCTLENEREAPSWLNERSPLGKKDHNWIAFQNGILNIENAATQGITTLLDHTPEWFSPVCLPYAYEPKAECKLWLEKLKEIFDADAERIALLQEWFGYCLTPDTSRQKFMLFEGLAGAGKGLIKEVLVQMLGEQNISTIPLELFPDKFQMGTTVGKLVNVIDETDKLERMAEGIFKRYVGEGLFYFDVKLKSGFQARPTARLLILSNDRLPITDKSDGMWRRMVLIPFLTATGTPDPELLQKLTPELPGIFNWSLDGLRRLRLQRSFTTSVVSESEKEVYKLESNPAKQFLCAKMEVGDTHGSGRHTSETLYNIYAEHCRKTGVRHPLGLISFNREVRRIFPGAHLGEVREAGVKMSYWIGIREQD